MPPPQKKRNLRGDAPVYGLPQWLLSNDNNNNNNNKNNNNNNNDNNNNNEFISALLPEIIYIRKEILYYKTP